MVEYPFSPAILDALPEEIAQLYRDLELKLLDEICSRLNISGQLNEVTVQDIRALRSHGITIKEIEDAIVKTTKISRGKLQKLLEDVVERNQEFYGELATLADITMPEQMVDTAVVDAIMSQTKGELKNITRSMGFVVGNRVVPPGDVYRRILDDAEMQIMSGGISYNQAIEEAVRRLTDSGLITTYREDKATSAKYPVVTYESGHTDHVDVAVRRATMSGINQLCSQYAIQSMDYLGTELVEVSAHMGARNTDGPNGWENHQRWQGGVYRWRR